jgi:hypothetical protein
MTFHEGPVDLEAMQRAQKAAPAAPNLVIPRPAQAGSVLFVSRERLEAPSQRVTVMNISPIQTHIVIDRHMHGHELRPGEKKEIEMLWSTRSRRSESSAAARRRPRRLLGGFGAPRPRDAPQAALCRDDVREAPSSSSGTAVASSASC